MRNTAGCDNRMFYNDAQEGLRYFADVKGHSIHAFENIFMESLDLAEWFLTASCLSSQARSDVKHCCTYHSSS